MTPTPRTKKALLCAVTAVLLAATGCSSDTDTPAADNVRASSPATASPAATSAPASTTTSPAPSTTTQPALSGPGTVCDPTPTRTVVINRGAVDCAQAIRIINATPGQGEQAPPSIEGWACQRAGGYGSLALQGYNYRCDHGTDEVLAQDKSVPVANNWVDSNDFYRNGDGQSGYYFTTPLHKYSCAILGTTPTDAHAGCHGPINAAPTINQGPQFTRANTIESTAGGAAGRLIQRGDPEYQFLGGGEPRPLDYNQPLFVNGYTCTTDKNTGTTCTNFATGHGFTVLIGSYRLF